MAIIEDTSKIENLNNLICEEEKELGKCYAILGKAYFEKYGENPDSDFVGFAADIKNINAKIDDYNAQIKELKGIISCPGCGADVYKTDTFCVGCGTRIAAPEPVEVVAPAPALQENKCAVCGAPLDDDSVFCTMCGTKVVAATPVVEAEPVVQMPAHSCAVCGAPLDDDSVFCTMCGAKVEPSAPVAEPVEILPEAEEVAPVAVEVTTPKCAVCGASLDDDSVFCTICGTKVEVPAVIVEETVAAPVAEPAVTVAPDEEIFVPSAPVTPAEEIFVPTSPVKPAQEVFVPTEPVASASVEQAPAKRFCMNCGKEVAPVAKFCIYCGSKQ